MFNRLSKIWQNISRSGVKDVHLTNTVRQIILLNQIVFIVGIVMMLYTFQYWLEGSWAYAYQAFGILIFFSIFFNYLNWYSFSRIYALSVCSFTIMMLASAHGFESGEHLSFIGIIFTIPIFYERRFQWEQILAFSIPIFCLAFLIYTDFSFVPEVELSRGDQKMIHFESLFTVIILGILIAFYFLNLAEKQRQTLVEAQQELKILFDIAPVGIFQVDLDNKEIIDCNERGLHLLEASSKTELLGKKIEYFVLDHERLNFESYDRSELRMKTCKESMIWVNIGVNVFSFNSSRRYLLHILNISAEKQAEIEMLKAKEEEISKEIALHKLRALRSQMNPHFLFNSLNSIQHFIAGNEQESALNYLSKFSRLIRQILENSTFSTITIADELIILKYYLELESLRFANRFDYQFEIDESIDTHNTEIPSLLIQPFVENAILHGLLAKNERGFLKVSLLKKNDLILCLVEDNGIGRKEAGIIKSKKSLTHRSMGMSMTKDRLEILQYTTGDKIEVNIEDLYLESGEAAGTRVKILIPCI